MDYGYLKDKNGKKISLESDYIIYKRNNEPLSLFMNNRMGNFCYNSITGEPGWHKILHIPNTGGWGNRTVVFTLTRVQSSDNGECIGFVTYYNNAAIQAKTFCNTISSDHLKVIKTDNGLDVYAYQAAYYRAIMVFILGMFNSSTENPE